MSWRPRSWSIVAAVCATLPGPSPKDRAAVQAMVSAPPPTETVGLDLLPIGGYR
jgi:nitrate reductase delta subunit